MSPQKGVIIQELLAYCKTLRLLYVEDNEEARKFTLEMLKRFFIHVTVACDGEEGLKAFKEGEFDLIITDINMPRMNGFEMILHIKEISPKIPILVLSAHNEAPYYKEADNIGIDGYLPKPLTLQQTIAAFEKLFKKEHL